MSKVLGISLVFVALLLGATGGAYAGYKYYPKKNPVEVEKTSQINNTVNSSSSNSTSSNAELESCLKAKWGEDKYAAITANPSLASVDDKFNALPCYK